MSKLICHDGPCKYHGWLMLVEWCRHPEILMPLTRNLPYLESAGGKCPCFIDFEAKVMPGNEPPWPMPAAISPGNTVGGTYPVGTKTAKRA